MPNSLSSAWQKIKFLPPLRLKTSKDFNIYSRLFELIFATAFFAWILLSQHFAPPTWAIIAFASVIGTFVFFSALAGMRRSWLRFATLGEKINGTSQQATEKDSEAAPIASSNGEEALPVEGAIKSKGESVANREKEEKEQARYLKLKKEYYQIDRFSHSLRGIAQFAQIGGIAVDAYFIFADQDDVKNSIFLCVTASLVAVEVIKNGLKTCWAYRASDVDPEHYKKRCLGPKVLFELLADTFATVLFILSASGFSYDEGGPIDIFLFCLASFTMFVMYTYHCSRANNNENPLPTDNFDTDLTPPASVISY